MMGKRVLRGALALTMITMAVLTVAVSSPAAAALVWDFSETGGNVFGVMSGSLDTTGLSLVRVPNVAGSGMLPNGAGLFSVTGFVPGVPAFRDQNAIAVPIAFGPGGLSLTTMTTGNVFAMSSNTLFLPDGYVSGNPLTGTLRFLGASLMSLGITPGSYVTQLPSDTITLNFPETPVPLPGTLALFASALAVVGLFTCKGSRT